MYSSSCHLAFLSFLVALTLQDFEVKAVNTSVTPVYSAIGTIESSRTVSSSIIMNITNTNVLLPPTSTVRWYENATVGNATSSTMYSNHTTTPTTTTTVDSSSSVKPTPTSTAEVDYGNSTTTTITTTADSSSFIKPTPTSTIQWSSSNSSIIPTTDSGPSTLPPTQPPYGSATTTATTKPTESTTKATTAAPTTTPPGPDPIMYPYGTEANDKQDTEHNYYWYSKCPEIQLDARGMVFFGRRHYKLYVCRNGMISFNHPWYRRWPNNFAKRYWFDEEAILAPYWALVDRWYSFGTGVSKVFYHLYKDNDKDPAAQNILRRAVEDVNKHAKNNMLTKEFTKATLVLVVTWVKIRHWYSAWRTELRDKNNTFQAVLITNNVYSFVMYNYPKNGIQWSVPAEREDYGRYYNSKGLPVVGFNAGHGNDIYYDHPRSGDVMVVDIDQIEGLNVFKSPDSQTIQATGNGMQGRVFIRLEDSRGEEDHRLRCVNWYYQQGDARAFTQSLEPCPCSVWQAWRDRRFRFTMWSWPRYCFYSRFPSSWGWGQECCYKFERRQHWWGW